MTTKSQASKQDSDFSASSHHVISQNFPSKSSTEFTPKNNKIESKPPIGGKIEIFAPRLELKSTALLNKI